MRLESELLGAREERDRTAARAAKKEAYFKAEIGLAADKLSRAEGQLDAQAEEATTEAARAAETIAGLEQRLLALQALHDTVRTRKPKRKQNEKKKDRDPMPTASLWPRAWSLVRSLVCFASCSLRLLTTSCLFFFSPA